MEPQVVNSAANVGTTAAISIVMEGIKSWFMLQSKLTQIVTVLVIGVAFQFLEVLGSNTALTASVVASAIIDGSHAGLAAIGLYHAGIKPVHNVLERRNQANVSGETNISGV